jgi:hypothetical protein
MGGNIKPGTPIATFLDNNFGQSNLYAGGGSGTPGAHKDHAAVFENYIRDANNKITGMNVEEQYATSGGMHPRKYMFGGGYGEADAANYAAIKTAAGGYLGGKNNPMAGETRTAGVSRPVTPTPHLGDMSMYQQDKGIRMVIRNQAGANIHAETASLGFTNGSIV